MHLNVHYVSICINGIEEKKVIKEEEGGKKRSRKTTSSLETSVSVAPHSTSQLRVSATDD